MIDIKITLGDKTYEGQVRDVTVPDPPPPPPPDRKNFSVWTGNTIPTWIHNSGDIARAIQDLNPYAGPTNLEWWVKVGEGGSWQATWDPHPMCPGSVEEMVTLVYQMSQHGIRVVPWVVLRGRPEWSEGEYEMIRACAAATGSCALNLENGPEYWNGPTDAGQVGEWIDRIGVASSALWLTAIPRQSVVNELGGNETMAMWLSKVSGASWECLVPETRVLTTSLDWVELGGLTVGQEIIGFDEQLGERPGWLSKYRPAVVEALRTSRKECFKVTTDRGTLVASAGHPWLIRAHLGTRATNRSHWARTDALRPGCEAAYFGEPWSRDETYDGGYLAGFLDGEGCIAAHHYGVGYSQLPGTTLERVRRLLTAKGHPISSMGVDPRSGRVREHVHGTYHALKILGQLRPVRLLPKAPAIWDGVALKSKPATIQEIEPVGEKEVVEIKTSTGTMIAGGFLTHNCYDAIAPDLAPNLAIPRVDAWDPTGSPWKRIPLVQRSKINNWAASQWANHALQVWHLAGD